MTIVDTLPTFFRWGRLLRARWKELLTIIFAQVVFAITAGVYTFLFWAHQPEISFVRYLGAGVTMWAALSGAYYFVVTQAQWVQGWFRGVSMLILGLNLLASQLLMASHSDVFTHALIIHLVLTMYCIWGQIGKKYYQKRSRKWFTIYKELLSHDIQFWSMYLIIAYLPFIVVAYLPFIQQDFFSSENVESFSDSITLFVLVAESISFSSFSFKHGLVDTQDKNGVLDVGDGYSKWAQLYDQGNAIVFAEREHTGARLSALAIHNKNIVDFGCGTGYYTEKLMGLGAASILSIDENQAMLKECKKKIPSGSSNVRVQIGGVAALSQLESKSIDGIFCTLVIDHLPEHELGDLLRLGYDALKPGGWIYITDVNPYYELLEHCYAKFIDEKGIEARIRVFPHVISATINKFKDAGFTNVRIEESNLPQRLTSMWEELGSLNDFPLILSYGATR